MPTYESLCDTCKTLHEYYQPVSNYLDTPECCGAKTRKVILTAAYGVPDVPEYISPVTGKWVRGKKQRQYDLESSGSRPYEGREAEEKEAARKRKYEDERQDKFYEKIVTETLDKLGPDKRTALLGTE